MMSQVIVREQYFSVREEFLINEVPFFHRSSKSGPSEWYYSAEQTMEMENPQR
jgi:hypothetical protein